jgi:hypothetical protein
MHSKSTVASLATLALWIIVLGYVSSVISFVYISIFDMQNDKAKHYDYAVEFENGTFELGY